MYIETNIASNENHMWLSIFFKSPGSRYKRIERVIVAAVFIYCSMLLNAIWYDLADETTIESEFSLGPFHLSYQQVYIGFLTVLVSFVPAWILEIIFKRSRPKTLKKSRAITAINKQRKIQRGGSDLNFTSISIPTPSKNEIHKNLKDNKNIILLPWWMRYIAWAFSIGIIAFSIAIVYMYGILWGETKTIQWLSSFIDAFLLSVFVIEWVKILISSVFLSCIVYKNQKDYTTMDIDCDEYYPPALNTDEEWEYTERNSNYITSVIGSNLTTPSFETLRTKLTKRREMNIVLKGIGTYFLFLAVIYTMVSGQTDINAYLLKNSITNDFVFNTSFNKVCFKVLSLLTKV